MNEHRRGESTRFSRVAASLVQTAKHLLYRRTIAVLIAAWILGVALVLWHVMRLQDRLVETAGTQGAALQTELLEAVRTLYTSEVVDRVRGRGIEVTHDYESHPHAIPLPVTFTIKLGENTRMADSGMRVKLYSDAPFRRSKFAHPLDDFGRAAIDYLRAHPDAHFSRMEEVDGRLSLRYATADRMRAQCIDCHNTHPDAPKHGWNVGDVRGVLEIIRPLEPIVAQTREGFRGTFLLVTGLSLLGVSSVALVIGKLRRSSEELEARVRERTAALQELNERLAQEVQEHERTEGQLAHTAKELARSNKDLEQFAYLASHDLQEPLRMVASYTQLLAQRYRGRLDSDADDFLAYAVDGARRMQKLIQDLLEYARLGRGKPSVAPLDVNRLFETVCGNLRAAIEECGAVITRGELPTVQAAATPLAQLLQNLLANALRFRSSQPPRIHVQATAREGEWLFSVRDNGIGIEPRFAERIFMPFERLHSRTEYPGTGMGLALCKRIVEWHGGRIWVESEAGHGATFYFTLPR